MVDTEPCCEEGESCALLGGGGCSEWEGARVWARVEKLLKHKEAPQDVRTHRDNDRGDKDGPPSGEGHGGGSRDVALTHYMVADGSCWGGGGKEGCKEGEGWLAQGSKLGD